MIDLRRQIEQANVDSSVREILMRITDAINVTERSLQFNRGDIVFLNEGKGPVVKNSDSGHFYRITITGVLGSETVTLVDLGIKPGE